MTKKTTRRERVRQKVQRRRQQQYLVVGVIVVIALAVVGVLAYLNLYGPVDFPENVASVYEGIPQSVTAEGYPRLGDPNAPVVIEDFSSFGCPACKDLSEQQLSGLTDEVRAGQVQIIFKPIPNIGDATHANNGARAALCAAEQGHFWEMYDIIFYWQGRYSVTENRIRAAGEELELDVDALMDCYDDGEVTNIVNRANAEFRAAGFNSTPQVRVNGQTINAFSVQSVVQSQIGQ